MKRIHGEIAAEREGEIRDSSPTKKLKLKNTVEEIYQKKSQLEHILLRPDTYIGNFLFFCYYHYTYFCSIISVYIFISLSNAFFLNFRIS